MRSDKPRLSLVKLLNDLADVSVALRHAGLEEEAIDRICRAVAASRLTARPVVPPRAEPEWDWRGGVWTPDTTSED